MSRIVILLLCTFCALAQENTEKVPPPPSNFPISPSIDPPNPTSSSTVKPTTTTTTTTVKPTTTTTTTVKPITTTTTVKPTTTTTTTVKPTTTTTTTTPKPTSPTKPTPSPPKPKPVEPAINNFTGNYSGTNRICLMMKMAVQIELLEKNSTKINVTSSVNSTAICANQSVETLELTWGNDSVTFTFFKNDSKVEIQSVIAIISLPGENATTYHHQKSEFSVSTTHSYKCAKDQSLNLTGLNSNETFAKLHISHLQYQAFMNTTTPQYDAAWYCDATNTPDIVPVVVGCVLAVLVVLVLVAYLFGRKRWQARGYLSM